MSKHSKLVALPIILAPIRIAASGTASALSGVSTKIADTNGQIIS